MHCKTFVSNVLPAQSGRMRYFCVRPDPVITLQKDADQEKLYYRFAPSYGMILDNLLQARTTSRQFALNL
jgi:hypothetical protein